jgi:O-antigen ligase
LLNFVPGLKMQVFEQYGQVDFRMEFIREYTGLEYQDYAMNGLTDIYAALGLAGFLVAGVVYALLLVFVSRRLAPGRSGAALLLGIFILCQMYSFEVAFATLPFGWTKSLPVLLVVLAINPYRVKVPRRQPNPAS